MEPEKLQEIVAENRELEKNLTKRNEQYIFDLKKSMKAANLSEQEQTLALHDILPVMVEEQKSGKTARQLFGTVSERTESILNKPVEKKESTPLLMWLDNAMLLMGALALMMSIASLLFKGRMQQMGLLALVIGSMVGGYALYLMYKYVYQYDRPGADKSKRPGFIKSGSIMVGAMFLWIITFSAAALLPQTINPVLDPVVMIVIGGAVLAARYFLKKKYNMQSSLAR